MKYGLYDTTKFTQEEANIYGRAVMDCMAHLHNEAMPDAQNALWFVVNRMKEQRGEKPIT